MKNSENVDGNAEDVKILILKRGKNVIDVVHQ